MPRRRSEDNPLSLFAFQDIIMSVSGIIILVVLLLGLRIAASSGTKGAGDESMPKMPDRSSKIVKLEAQVARAQQKLQEEMDKNLPKEDDSDAPRSQAAVLRALVNTNGTLKAELGNSKEALSRTKGDADKLRKKVDELGKVLATIENKRQIIPDQLRLRPEKDTNATIYVAVCSKQRILCGALGQEKAKKIFAATPAGRKRLVAYAEELADTFADLRLVLLMKPSSENYCMKLVESLKSKGIQAIGYDPLEEHFTVFRGRQP